MVVTLHLIILFYGGGTMPEGLDVDKAHEICEEVGGKVVQVFHVGEDGVSQHPIRTFSPFASGVESELE